MSSSSVRYGVFLRPDPSTCARVWELTHLLEHQYGLRSAAAFPPHITLVGNIALRDPSAAGQDGLRDALAPVLTTARPATLPYTGLRDADGAIVAGYADVDGTLTTLRARIAAAVSPLSERVEDHASTPWQELAFLPHISMASHDLQARPDLAAEVRAFLLGLERRLPARITDASYTLVRMHAADFSSPWWNDLRCEVVHSWGYPLTLSLPPLHSHTIEGHTP